MLGALNRPRAGRGTSLGSAGFDRALVLLHFAHAIEVRRLVHGDFDELDRSTLEPCRGLVLLAHGFTAVVADAQTVASQRELAQLRLKRAFGDDPAVDVEPGLAEVLLVLAFALADELHAEDVLAG